MSALTRTVALWAALVAAGAAAAPLPALQGDGWKSWRVPAVPDAPAWCCYRWRGDAAEPARCDLAADHGFGGHGDRPSPTHMRVYAHLEDGRWREIRAFAADCPVDAPAPIADLGDVDAASSVAALARHLHPRGRLTDAALAAIAVHDGGAALDALRTAAGTDRPLATRQHAVFWLGQTRVHDGAQDLTRHLERDADPELRAHAAFSVSQSALADRSALLIRQAREDASADVRGQAWFWLAKTGAPDSEAALRRALADEPSAHVREQAVFALSQLPAPRAVRALIAVIESRDVAERERKRALFWLAHSDEADAHAFLDRVLTD